MSKGADMKVAVIIGCFLALATAACGGGDSTAPTLTSATPPVTTEMFSGTVDVAGTDVHPFDITLSNSPVTSR